MEDDDEESKTVPPWVYLEYKVSNQPPSLSQTLNSIVL